jgi:hypothetical protein
MSCDGSSTKDFTCSLGPEELRERLAEIRALTRWRLRERMREGLRLMLAYDGEAEQEVRTLVSLERQCCTFLDFAMHSEGGRFIVTIAVPAAAARSIEEILSEFAGEAVTPTAQRDHGPDGFAAPNGHPPCR